MTSGVVEIESNFMPIASVVQMLEKDQISFKHYDAEHYNQAWKTWEKSQFFETLLLGIPMQPIFLWMQPGNNKYIIIDGYRRLRALFINKADNKVTFSFERMKILTKYENMRFSSLPRQDERKILSQQVQVNIIRKGTPQDVVKHIYRLLHKNLF